MLSPTPPPHTHWRPQTCLSRSCLLLCDVSEGDGIWPRGLFLQGCGAGTGQQGEWLSGLWQGGSGHPRGRASHRETRRPAAAPPAEQPLRVASSKPLCGLGSEGSAAGFPEGSGPPGLLVLGTLEQPPRTDAGGPPQGPLSTSREGSLHLPTGRAASLPRWQWPWWSGVEAYKPLPESGCDGRGRAGLLGRPPGAGGHRVADAIPAGQEAGPEANTASDEARACWPGWLPLRPPAQHPAASEPGADVEASDNRGHRRQTARMRAILTVSVPGRVEG